MEEKKIHDLSRPKRKKEMSWPMQANREKKARSRNGKCKFMLKQSQNFPHNHQKLRLTYRKNWFSGLFYFFWARNVQMIGERPALGNFHYQPENVRMQFQQSTNWQENRYIVNGVNSVRKWSVIFMRPRRGSNLIIFTVFSAVFNELSWNHSPNAIGSHADK